MATKFEVLDAIGPNWDGLPAARRKALLEALQNPTWRFDGIRRRYGFRQFEQYDDNVYAGWFAIESKLHYLTYDDAGNEPEPGEITEFERVLAILLVDEGRWVLHERRFFRTDLTKPLVRDRFRDALIYAFSDAGMSGNVRVEPFQQTLTERQMLERFQSEAGRVIRLDVKRMHGQQVPDEFKFFNPKFELDKEVHDLFDRDLIVLDDAEFEAAPSADIRDSKIASALSRTGSVESFSIQDHHGRRLRLRRVIPATFELSIDIDDIDDKVDMDRAVREVVAFVREEYPSIHGDDVYRGGLFAEAEEGSDDGG